jgi:nitrate reductase gamma subunit
MLYDTFLFPTVLRHKPPLWVFLVAFHLSLILLLIGHLELIAEFRIFQIVPHEVFIDNGFVGLTLAVCLLFFLLRRMISPVKDLSVPRRLLPADPALFGRHLRQ